MIKQKAKQIMKKNRLSLMALAAVSVVAFSLVTVPMVRADQFDDKVRQLREQNTQNQASANQLQVQATSYQDTINKLQGQIDALQNSINSNTAKQTDLQSQIIVAESELAKQKKVLGTNIRQMYFDGQVSTIEMLASSKDLSEYIDKERYRNVVKDKIKDTMDKITALRHQLSAQKEEVDKLILDQQGMRNQVAAQRTQQDQMLAYTQDQKNQFNQKIKETNSQIADLKRQQAAENARLFGGANVVLGSACDTANGDTYPSPWCGAVQDSMVDSWGMFNRECVSYVAWKVADSGRHMPYWGGVGNAWQWAFSGYADPGDGHQVYYNNGNWHNANAPSDNNPRRGDAAVKNGVYGHVMYVEDINSDGTINISQYNANLNGQFSRAYNVNPSGLRFIHF